MTSIHSVRTPSQGVTSIVSSQGGEEKSEISQRGLVSTSFPISDIVSCAIACARLLKNVIPTSILDSHLLSTVSLSSPLITWSSMSPSFALHSSGIHKGATRVKLHQ